MEGQIGDHWRRLAVEANYDSRNLASLRKITPRQLQRIFRAEFNRTPQTWLNEQRIRAAQELLRTGDPVKKIAYDLGFKQASHFCRHFKSISGVSPSRYKVYSSTATNVAIG